MSIIFYGKELIPLKTVNTFFSHSSLVVLVSLQCGSILKEFRSGVLEMLTAVRGAETHPFNHWVQERIPFCILTFTFFLFSLW